LRHAFVGVDLRGSGVVLENSKVTCPSHSGSKGVTLHIIPQRAYVDLPRQTVNTLRGILKYSTVPASAKEFGGMMHTGPLKSTNDFSSNFFGLTMRGGSIVKIFTIIPSASSISKEIRREIICRF